MWDLNSNQTMQIAQVGWERPNQLQGPKNEPESSYTCQNVSSQHDGPIKSIHWIKAPNYSCVMTGSWDKTLKVSQQTRFSAWKHSQCFTFWSTPDRSRNKWNMIRCQNDAVRVPLWYSEAGICAHKYMICPTPMKQCYIFFPIVLLSFWMRLNDIMLQIWQLVFACFPSVLGHPLSQSHDVSANAREMLLCRCCEWPTGNVTQIYNVCSLYGFILDSPFVLL